MGVRQQTNVLGMHGQIGYTVQQHRYSRLT